MREDLRVPTVAITAAVTFDDGGTLNGRIFLPAMASRHSGQPRPDEWINQPTGFFPLLAEGDDRAVILNKSTVSAISIPLTPDLALDDTTGFTSEVELTWGGHVIEGKLLIDMPAERNRVLDYLNTSDRFLTLWTDTKYHLIRKDCIMRIVEREA